MADDTTKELLVRVSATTELLRSQLTAAERQIDSFEKTATQSTTRINQAFQRGAVSSGQMKFAMRDLSMQVGDMATQFAMGQRAMQIFAAQGPQVVGALQLMAGEATALGRFMGGPWPTLITAGALALGPLIARFFDTGDAAKNAADSIYDLKKALADLSTKPMEALGNLQSRVFVAQGKLRAAQAMRVGTRGEGIQRAQAIQAAQAELDSAQTDFRVASFTARSLPKPVERAAARSPRVRAATPKVDPFFRKLDELEGDNSQGFAKLAEERSRLLGRAAEESWKEESKRIRQAADYEYDIKEKNLERLKDIERTQLATLSGLYEDLFSGGTKAIWDDFAKIGERVIAQVLARFTLAKATGGGFDLGSALLGSFSSVLGFRAAGGPVTGGSPYVVGEKGPELFVPGGSGSIIPNGRLFVPHVGALGDSGRTQVVEQHFDLRGAVVTERLYDQMNAIAAQKVIQAAPSLTAAAVGQTARINNRRTL